MLKRLIVCGIVLLIGFFSTVNAGTYYVPDDYLTIQSAIDASDNGDTIIVRPGTYMERIDFLGKSIYLQSERGPLQTTISNPSSGGSVVVFVNQEGPDSVLEGFTVTNGWGTQGPTGDLMGGGIWCYESNPRILNNIIQNNSADMGGGIAAVRTSVEIRNNVIISNAVNDNGGGLMFAESLGGAPSVENNLICENTAWRSGGGIYAGKNSQVEIINNTLCENYSYFVDGGGISCQNITSVNVYNSIIWGNLSTSDVYVSVGPQPTITYSDVGGGYIGVGNFDLNPLLVTGFKGDHYLSHLGTGQAQNSPCVDAGDPASPMIKGSTRTDGQKDKGVVDIGYHYEIYFLSTPHVPAIKHDRECYVPDDFPTIQEALDDPHVYDHDVVIVRPGVYEENIVFPGKAITLKSEMGPERTIIDGGQLYTSIVTFDKGERKDTVLEGFTITNGRGDNGGAISCINSSPIIRGNIIRGNRSAKRDDFSDGYGGAIYCQSCSPVIDSNIINNNCAEFGGGIYGQYCNNLYITNNMIFDNYIIESYYFTKSKIRFIGGAGIHIESCDASIINNTIMKNTANVVGGNGHGLYCDASNPVIANTIVRDNQVEISSGLQVSYCNIKGGYPGLGNIDVDPGFIKSYDQDYHISYDSSCRNAGDNYYVPTNLKQDYERDPRISDFTVDIGADEFYPHLYKGREAILPRGEATVTIVGNPGTFLTMGLGSGLLLPPRHTPYGNIFLEDPISKYDLGILPAEGYLEYTTTLPASWNPGEEYPIQMFFGIQGATDSMISNPLMLLVGGRTITVPDDYVEIQEAINVANDGDIILVKPGNYFAINLHGKSITIKGEKGPEETIIQGNGYCVVSFVSGEGRDTVLKGFTITGGDAWEGGGIYCFGSSPTINGNVIESCIVKCHLYHNPACGGGICCRCFSRPIIVNNIIRNCRATNFYMKYPVMSYSFGGGLYLGYYCDAVILNSIVRRNSTVDWSLQLNCDGGGMYCWEASPSVTNSTFSRNSASNVDRGGTPEVKAVGGRGPVMTNSIIWNTSTSWSLDGPMTLSYCDTFVLYPGTGNINVDPAFADDTHQDYHITYNSPCRNSGTNNAPDLELLDELFDFEGDPRFAEGSVDMGADDFYPHLYYFDKSYSPYIQVVGEPGMDPVFIIQGSGVQDPPAITPYGDLYLYGPAVFVKRTGPITSSGVFSEKFTNPGHMLPGETYPFQALIGDKSNPDAVLTNLLLFKVPE